MARRFGKSAPASSLDWSEVGRLLRDLERGVSLLAAFVAANARETGSSLPDRVSGALSDISERVRNTISHNRRGVGGDAMRLGTGAWHRLEDEVAHRPLLALAIAAGIGFVIGALRTARSE